MGFVHSPENIYVNASCSHLFQQPKIFPFIIESCRIGGSFVLYESEVSRMAGKKNNKTAGRPTKMTEEVVGKLECAFSKDFNVCEACDYAGIHRDSYYEWLKKDAEFSDRMEQAQTNLKRKAKINIADKIEEGNMDVTKWFLERRAKDEYSVKQSVEVTGIEEEQSKLSELLEQRRQRRDPKC